MALAADRQISEVALAPHDGSSEGKETDERALKASNFGSWRVMMSRTRSL